GTPRLSLDVPRRKGHSLPVVSGSRGSPRSRGASGELAGWASQFPTWPSASYQLDPVPVRVAAKGNISIGDSSSVSGALPELIYPELEIDLSRNVFSP